MSLHLPDRVIVTRHIAENAVLSKHIASGEIPGGNWLIMPFRPLILKMAQLQTISLLMIV